MYLSKLELHGFKSFAQKTTLAFDPGVTAIVGPNGCGKSNVIDAVRWVLGEQRARLLRSERMENVIFNGTAKRRALGMAEVSLTIENTRGVLPTEYSEVTITRRLFRSGESAYLLNGAVCRLKDILDLFMDTGMGAGAYSVIELKMIEDILSDNAADRRRLFEEAAGVTRYKLRRRQALSKLDDTRADLTRLTDLVEEVERTVRSLGRQAKAAARHQRLRGRLETLELALAAFDYEQLADEHRTLDRETRALRTQVEGLTAQVTSAEAALESQRTALVGHEGGLAERQTALNAHIETVRGLEAEQRVAAERRAADERTRERLAREAEEDAGRRGVLTTEQDVLATQQADADATLAQAEAAEQEARTARDATVQAATDARAQRDAARQGVADKEKAALDAHAALERLHDRRALREQEQERLAAELDDLTARAETETPTATRAEDAATALAEAEAARDTARALREARREAHAHAETALRDARLARDTARAEVSLLRSLVAEGEGVSSAVTFLADHEDWASETATVADLIAADEPDRLALDVALGEWADCLVVQSETEAQEGIARLRVAEAGRATFVVLDKLPARAHAERSPTPPGATPALDVARVPHARFKPLLRLLFQNVFVVDTLDDAQRLRDDYPVARFVTREGEWTSARGLIAGGRGAGTQTSHRLGRRERLDRAEAALAAAETTLEEAEADAAQTQEALEGSEAALRHAEAEGEAARRAHDDARTAAAREEAEQAAREGQRTRLAERLAALEEAMTAEPDAGALQRAAAQIQSDAEAARAALDAAEAAHETAEAERRTAEAAHSETRLALLSARTAAEALQRDRDRIARTLEELDQREAARTDESQRLATALADADTTQAELAERLDAERTGSDALQTAVSEAEQAVLEARALIADTEKLVRGLRASRDEALHRQTSVDLRLTEIITRQDALAERLEEEHAASLDDATERLDALQSGALAEEDELLAGPFDADKARRAIPQLRDRLRSLGAVNELALESYEEEKERLDFLAAQQADLQAAEQTLLDTIAEINTTAAQRFDATFADVRTAFQRLFADLFGENAAADLLLDGDDPLEAPIEITARPKGKKPSTIDQLSGGEKTLTAIALLFAIYLVKPSPFCILDEVDAPLDDANIARFMQLIRSFAASTQFILVTHNKLTMEAADRMYGITMPEPGVSRLVGVRFDEVVDEPEAAVA